jgi:hypothetical protein
MIDTNPLVTDGTLQMTRNCDEIISILKLYSDRSLKFVAQATGLKPLTVCSYYRMFGIKRKKKPVRKTYFCKSCELWKPRADFYFYHFESGNRYHPGYCRECRTQRLEIPKRGEQPVNNFSEKNLFKDRRFKVGCDSSATKGIVMERWLT